MTVNNTQLVSLQVNYNLCTYVIVHLKAECTFYRPTNADKNERKTSHAGNFLPYIFMYMYYRFLEYIQNYQFIY